MKKLITFISILALLCSVELFAAEDQGVSVVKVYDDLGVKKDVIYNAVLASVAQIKGIEIRMQDKDSGKIVCFGKGALESFMYTGFYTYTMTVDVKDGKMRVSFDNVQDDKINPAGIASWKNLKGKQDAAKKQLEEIAEKLYAAMKNAKNDQW